MKKIKSISTMNYKIALFENYMYYNIVTQVDGKIVKSENINTLNVANDLFEMKLNELEGIKHETLH